MDSEAGFNEDVLFTVGETKFQQKCARIDVCGLAGVKGTGKGGTVDVLETVGDE